MTNPIVTRELVGVIRSQWAPWLLVVLVVCLSALVLVRWPEDATVSLSGYESLQVFRIFSLGLLVGLILLSPAFPAASIVRERKSGTLQLLLNSPLTPLQIYIGKFTGVTGFVMLLVASSIPAAAACYAMGGVDLWRQIGAVYLVLFLLTLQYASLGLWISSWASAVDGAMRITYLAVLALTVFTVIPAYFLVGLGSLNIQTTFIQFELSLEGPVGIIVDWLRCLSPIPAMMQAMGQEAIGSRGLADQSNPIGRYVILSLASTAVFSMLTIRKLNGFMMDRPRSVRAATDDRSGAVQAYRRVMYLWFFDPQRRSGTTRMLNPVMVKEFRSRTLGRGHWLMRMVSACFVLSLGLAFASTLTWQGRLEQEENVGALGGLMVVLQVGLIMLITPSLASGLISSERESGGWQLLQMTPLTALKILSGKLMSVVWMVVLVLVATLPGYAVMIWITPETMNQVIDVIITLVLIAAFAILLSAMISSFVRATTTATAASYTLLLLVCVGPMLAWAGEDAPFTRSFVEQVLMVSPLAAALSLIETPGFSGYALVPTNWIFMGVCIGIMFLVLVMRTWRLMQPR